MGDQKESLRKITHTLAVKNEEISNFICTLKQSLENLEANSNRVQDDLQSEFGSLHAALDEMKENMLTRIKQERASRTYELQNQLSACSKALESSEELLELANQTLCSSETDGFTQRDDGPGFPSLPEGESQRQHESPDGGLQPGEGDAAGAQVSPSSRHSRDPGVRVPSVRQHRHHRLDPTGTRQQDRALHPGAPPDEPRGPATYQRGLPLDGGGGDPGDGAHAHRSALRHPLHDVQSEGVQQGRGRGVLRAGHTRNPRVHLQAGLQLGAPEPEGGRPERGVGQQRRKGAGNPQREEQNQLPSALARQVCVGADVPQEGADGAAGQGQVHRRVLHRVGRHHDRRRPAVLGGEAGQGEQGVRRRHRSAEPGQVRPAGEEQRFLVHPPEQLAAAEPHRQAQQQGPHPRLPHPQHYRRLRQLRRRCCVVLQR
ncbi:fibronectin type III and SPRY domain-containing protein 1 isoform X3 [Poecilia latipinna]|uniref:fibronectin type III and SPRY domain-containing protein 1 isoform X3 n=1 Tax=Poecilia latipinna TaxID=48699 RepID=UPI00072E9752|nr:PREDICTED: fibronectin type III and SPRY domain-containing protein 1 isoform X3 [Poecilia latipinna]XP_016518825.1 PREDICTED: fibronectin type III and SPRY domain-containing protein 1 isoform X3 [Poecilia formosa]